MNGKFGREYVLDIFTPAGKRITIQNPFTLQGKIARNTLASANTGNFTIKNLRESTRNQIYKDRFSVTEYWRVRLFAGYENRLYEVFTGNALEAYSYKEGPDWITVLDCFDGMDAIQNGFTSMTIQSGTQKSDIFGKIISDMPNVVKGIFGQTGEGVSSRGKSLLGQSASLLNIETDGNYFIDRETVNVLTRDEILPGAAVVLDPGQLLTTPRRREAFLDVQALFDPQVQVGQVFEIRSLESRFNGVYGIQGFSHNFVISDGVNGDARTDLSLYFGAAGLQEVG